MRSSTIALALAGLAGLAGLASAYTPLGFVPQNNDNLTVAFGSTLATNGAVVPRDATASSPTLGTDFQLPGGPYTIMMVDPDVPTSNSSGPTVEMLLWIQSGLYSANTSTTIGGRTSYELVNPEHFGPYGGYMQPNPPAKAPYSHRIVQLLLNTTGLPVTNESALGLAGIGQRTPFNATLVIQEAAVAIVGSNWFNVTNGQAPCNQTSSSGSAAAGPTTNGSASAAGSATATATGPASVTSLSATAAATNGAGALSREPSLLGRLGVLGFLGIAVAG